MKEVILIGISSGNLSLSQENVIPEELVADYYSDRTMERLAVCYEKLMNHFMDLARDIFGSSR